MTKGQRINGILFLIVFSGLFLALFLQNRAISEKLAECSSYTVADIKRVYTLRAMVQIKYTYKVGNQIVEASEGVDGFDTHEFWNIDLNKLENRKRLLLKFYCADINVHQILWDSPVPDTLDNIPTQGWKETPF